VPPHARIRWDVVQHSHFGDQKLRGLRWKASPRKTKQLLPSSKKKKRLLIAEIPMSKTLSTTTPQGAFDPDFIVKLWHEASKPSLSVTSQYGGYLQFLVDGWKPDGERECPDPVAPNAVRHWTDEQRLRLSACGAGRQLLDAAAQQDENWRNAYEENRQLQREMTFSQFVWCMEIVHSRAFRGTGDDGTAIKASEALLPSLVVPLLATAAGLAYSLMWVRPGEEPSPIVLAVLAATATLPLVLHVFEKHRNSERRDSRTDTNYDANNSSTTMVLLPFIDSANHKEDADSRLEYNPVTDCFELSIGPNCIDHATGQVYVSYGPKSDLELLLNYGFLPGCIYDGSTTDVDGVRATLASEYCRRNPGDD